jgi:hypothetical protein
MPLLPIDLQTLFAQLNQVGKEQAAQKELVPNAQAVQGSQLARQTDERDNKVNATQPQEQKGAEPVRGRNRRERKRKRAPREAAKEEKPASVKKDVFQDPALGSRIDITG